MLPSQNGFGACVSRGNTIASGVAGEGSSHRTGYRRLHVRHSYQPCVGHIGSSCMNLHQKSAIRAMASTHSFPSGLRAISL
jgi:hypothetical protein